MVSPELKNTSEGMFMTCWYQPIYEIKNNTLHGYEALARHKKQPSINPMDIFTAARSTGILSVLDQQLIVKAQKITDKLNGYPLFINIFPSTMLQKDFILWWDKYSGYHHSIVLEISESEPINDWPYIKKVINELKKRNVKIAIDDMGAGYASLKYWIELKPDYIKLDRYYISDITNCSDKQKILKNMVSLIDRSTKIIAEGVETIQELNLIRNMGIKYAQGYYLGKPAPSNKIK